MIHYHSLFFRNISSQYIGILCMVHGLILHYLKRTARKVPSLWEAILEPFGLHDLDSYMAADQHAVNEIRCGLDG